MILVCLDGTEGSWQALDEAMHQVQAHESWLLVNVIPDAAPSITGFFAAGLGVNPNAVLCSWAQYGEYTLEEGRRRIHTFFGSQTVVLMRLEEAHHCTVGKTLAQIIRDEQPRLAVLGAHGEHPEVSNLGLTVHWVVQHEKSHTLIVHSNPSQTLFEPLVRGGTA